MFLPYSSHMLLSRLWRSSSLNPPFAQRWCARNHKQPSIPQASVMSPCHVTLPCHPADIICRIRTCHLRHADVTTKNTRRRKSRFSALDPDSESNFDVRLAQSLQEIGQNGFPLFVQSCSGPFRPKLVRKHPFSSFED